MYREVLSTCEDVFDVISLLGVFLCRLHAYLLCDAGLVVFSNAESSYIDGIISCCNSIGSYSFSNL